MKQPTHVRKGKTITGSPENTSACPRAFIEYFSFNEAKRRSREIQLKADGALGRGTLRLAGRY